MGDLLMWQRHGKSRDEVAKMYVTEGALSDLNAGGRLDPAQQLGMINAVRSQSTLLGPYIPGAQPPAAGGQFLPPNASPNPLLPNQAPEGMGMSPVAAAGPGISFLASSSGRTSGKIESFLATGYVMRGATQATESPGPAPRILRPRTAEWAYRKYHVFQEWSKEQTYQTILEDRWSEFLMSRLFPVMASNLEEAALHGDEDIVADDARSVLLRENDGWLKQMKNYSPSFSYDGNFVDEALFLRMIRSFPSLFKPKRKFWFCNDAIPTDWMELMGAKGAGAVEASQYLLGRAPMPFGIPFWTVPLLAIDEPVTTIAAATNARVKGAGSARDQYIFPTDAYRVTINVDGEGAVTIALPHTSSASLSDRSISIYRLCKLINDALVEEYGSNDYKFVATAGQFGELVLTSPTAGAGSSIELTAPASSALGVLGLTAGTYSGQAAAAGGTNTAYIGTSMFLTLPENLQWRVSTAPAGSDQSGFQQYIKYTQERDVLRYDQWSHHDFTLDTPEAAVYVHGIRAAKAGETPVP
jgi:hypothetical protein